MASKANNAVARELPEIFLLLNNPKKSNNLGPVLRCASAFGITTIVAVGHDKCAVAGSHGASKHVQIVGFPVGDQAASFVRNECQCKSILGLMGPLPGGYNKTGYSVVENHESGKLEFAAELILSGNEDGRPTESITRRSYPVDNYQFAPGNICFVVDKERQGLPCTLANLCDSFVHIPHGTNICSSLPLLDPPACLSILLHSFTERAGYDERTFVGHKFDVNQRTKGTADGDLAKARRNERDLKRKARDAEVEAMVSEGALATDVFGVKENDGDY